MNRTDARATLETSFDPVEVAAAALALRDLQPIARVGGGFAIGGRAHAYAEDVVEALAMRGMLAMQGRLL